MIARKTFALAGALTAALLLSTAGAMAAPYDGHGYDGHATAQRHDRDGYGDRHGDRDGHDFDRGRGGYDSHDRARDRDRDHRPPLRVEFVGRAPHAGMVFRQGHWLWQGDEWVWIGGMWLNAVIR